ncbi:MAG: TIGR03032 family protein [Chloroflexota bacterium]
MSNSTQKPLRSVHTSNFPDILKQLGISLVVSTYQAGKVILVRPDNDTLNTHFRTFQKPMGLAGDHTRLSIGTASEVWHLRNMPAVALKLDPPGKHDAYYLPRSMHATGDIDIHEMAWGFDLEQGDTNGDTLWIVNTRFCCLCTLDATNSFVPRWRPHFISALAPEDRCHLNGLGMVDGRPKFVTALGETDHAGGWRDNKANGGILMDVDDNRVLMRSISMPHSPRVYNGQLWLLESGEGALSKVHLGETAEQSSLEMVAQMPGFTRGIDFYGPLAFIGLSQVRESATFSGLPLTKRLTERTCGVWVINITTGETVAFLRFEEGVQEIFSVQVLPGVHFPDIFEWGDERLRTSYVLPDEAMADVAAPKTTGDALSTASRD